MASNALRHDAGVETHQRLRILVVEDDPAYAAFVATVLQSIEFVLFDVEHVQTVARAVTCLRDGSFSVVLLDLGLGDAQGLEALNAVVAAVPDVPVIILSGEDDLALSLGAVKSGAQDYLLKSQATPGALTRSIGYAIERKNGELETKRLAYHDSLTRLPNRLLLMEHLELALRKANRGKTVLGIFFIDVDHFKQINDTLGHEMGDTVLQETARRLTNCLRGSDTVARLSGDEFVALVETNRRSELTTVADAVQEQFRRAFAADNGDVFITASIGVSSYPIDGLDAKTLLRNADRAMYRAKTEGRDSYRFYSARHYATPSGSLVLNSRLRQAIDRQELVLHFQPLVNLRGKGVDGIEALVRWQHPTLGLIPPAHFIPMAEESGLILSIERWVLESAMRAAGTLQGERPLKVAVNLSTRHFDHPALLNELRTFSRAVDYDPGLLELELTESGIMHHPKRVLRHLKGFRRLGVRVAIDDFGTGYSCLSLMNRFPLHALKIDRSFVVDCATNPTNQALVAAIIRMGHALGLEVTAEGVETSEQLTYLREQGCDRAQGWLFSPAVAAAELPGVFGALRHFGR
jgi:diguanylate cyclase (GGDEF)-like protein